MSDVTITVDPSPISVGVSVSQPAQTTVSVVTGGGGGGITDAPNDGHLYGRKNNAWVSLSPVNVTLPTISGTLAVGYALSANSGSWDYSQTYAYQWRHSSDGTNWTNIDGATGSTYTCQSGDLGFYIDVVVTASNDWGTSSATSSPTTTVFTISLLSSLLAYWNFDDSGWEDSTGNGFALSQIGSGVSIGTGLLNGDASFDGDGSTYLTTGSNIVPTGLSSFSMSFWVKATTGFFICCASSGSSYPNSGPSIFDNQWTVYTNNDGSGDNINFSSIADGNWHHLVGTWNQFGYTTVYVDGSQIAQQPSSGNPMNTSFSNPFVFNGNGDATYAVGQPGEIDEGGIWNRELSASEVTALYNGGTPLPFSSFSTTT